LSPLTRGLRYRAACVEQFKDLFSSVNCVIFIIHSSLLWF